MLREQAEAVLRRTGWLSRQPVAFQDRVLVAAELRRFPPGRPFTRWAIRLPMSDV